MRLIDPDAVVLLENDGATPYPNGKAAGTSTPWAVLYSTWVPMTTRQQTHRYRVYVPRTGSPGPFILVRGERLYLTPELAEKVTAS